MGYDVAFFTEAGFDRGMGHLVRTYSIYSYFKNNKYNTSFFLDSNINYDYKFKDLNYIKFDKLSYCIKYEIVFIDSYTIDINTYINLLSITKLLIVIDDYHRIQYPKESIILNFAPDAKEKFINSNYFGYLLGLKYMPLRKNLIDIKKKSLEKENFIFIILGGNDILNLNQKILNLLGNNIKKVIVHNNGTVLNIDKNTIILKKPNDDLLLSYMSKAKYAISTASMSLYELNFFQIPTIAIPIVENQIQGIVEFKQYNILNEYVELSNIQKVSLLKLLDKLPQNNISVIPNNGIENIKNKIEGYL